MQIITTSEELKVAIRQLELEQSEKEQSLRGQFILVRQKLEPASLLKTIINEVFTGPSIIRTVLTTTLGLTAGYLTKRYFTGLPGSLLKRLLSNFL
jgi:hypothetical protein